MTDTAYRNPYLHAREVANIYDVQRGGFDPVRAEPFLRLCDAISTGGDRLSRNYARENFGFEGHLTIDALLDPAGEIVEFEGLFRRDWWPDGVWRIKNRYYIREEYRHPNLQHARPTQERLLTRHQIDRAVRHGAKALFVSVEGAAARRKLQFLLETTAPHWHAHLRWKHPDRHFRVADCDSRPCWQQIVYANIAPEYDLRQEPWFCDSKSTDEWRGLPP